MLRSDTTWGTLFGAYLISLGLNYVPLLLHAISLARPHAAHLEIADEIADKRRTSEPITPTSRLRDDTREGN